MTDDPGTPRKRLYLISGVMQRNTGAAIENRIMPGLLLAASEDEARGAHLRWMQEQQPGAKLDCLIAVEIEGRFIRQAALETGNV